MFLDCYVSYLHLCPVTGENGSCLRKQDFMALWQCRGKGISLALQNCKIWMNIFTLHLGLTLHVWFYLWAVHINCRQMCLMKGLITKVKFLLTWVSITLPEFPLNKRAFNFLRPNLGEIPTLTSLWRGNEQPMLDPFSKKNSLKFYYCGFEEAIM